MRDYNERQLHRKRIWRGALIALLLLVLFVGGLWALHWWEESSAPADPDDPVTPGVTRPSFQRGDALYDLRSDVETLLIIGLDKYEESIDKSFDGYRNNQQADFLLLLVVDHAEKNCRLLQINRDTMSRVQILGITGDVAGEQVEQLALAHTYGSGREDSGLNTAQAVSDFLYHTPIDHYVAVTMDAVPLLNDAVGGVTVEVLDDFSNVDKTLVKGQTVTLRGRQALTYVRARYGVEDQTNLTRMVRQRQYMAALQTKLVDKVTEDSDFASRMLLDMLDYMTTDCRLQYLSNMANYVAKYGFSEIVTPSGESRVGERNGQPVMEFYVDDEPLQALVLDWFYRPAQDAPQQVLPQQ